MRKHNCIPKHTRCISFFDLPHATAVAHPIHLQWSDKVFEHIRIRKPYACILMPKTSHRSLGSQISYFPPYFIECFLRMLSSQPQWYRRKAIAIPPIPYKCDRICKSLKKLSKQGIRCLQFQLVETYWFLPRK